MLRVLLPLAVWMAATAALAQEETTEKGTTVVRSGAEAEEDSPRKEKSFTGLGIPLLSYNSDLGWGFGAVGGGYFYAPGYEPYRHAFSAQAFITTRGVQNHFLRYDGVNLIGRARVEGKLEFRRELLSPYYGAGNLSALAFNPAEDIDNEFYNFDRTSPAAWLRVRLNPVGPKHPLEVFGHYQYRYVRVNPYEQSLLQAQRPIGLEGGSNGQLMVGLLWDTRDDEADTTRGGQEEIALRVSAGPTGSAYTFAGITLSERRFWRLNNRLVLAERVAFDYLAGDVPFFEWANIGGVTNAEGIGGMSSVRGVPRNRFVGNVKIFSNTELRYTAYWFQLLGQRTEIGGLAFADIGRVWHPNEEDGTLATWHPGVGAGLRVVQRAAVLRFDYAVDTDTLRQGIYVTFGHLF